MDNQLKNSNSKRINFKSKKNIAIVVIMCSIAVAAVCIFVNIFAFYLPAKRKNEENKRLLEAYYQEKIEQFEQENLTLSNVDVVFLGDSLTDGYNLEEYYPEYSAINRGIGGDTTFGLEKRLKVSAYDVNPKVVCMLIGGNNLSTMMQNYEQILIKLKENLPSSKIVLLSLTAMGNEWAKNNNKAILNNQKIKGLADYYNFEYVDLFTPLYDYKTEQIKEGYSTDGVHLSAQGYEIITNQIKPIIKAYLD